MPLRSQPGTGIATSVLSAASMRSHDTRDRGIAVLETIVAVPEDVATQGDDPPRWPSRSTTTRLQCSSAGTPLSCRRTAVPLDDSRSHTVALTWPALPATTCTAGPDLAGTTAAPPAPPPTTRTAAAAARMSRRRERRLVTAAASR